MKIRILLVLPLDGGSLIVGRHVAQALAGMPKVELNVLETQSLCTFYEKSFGYLEDDLVRRKKIVEHINLAAMGKVVDFRPDLVLVMALAPISPWFIEKTSSLGVVTAHWYVENYRYYPSNPLLPTWQIVAPYYNYFFTIQRGAFHEKLHEMGVQHTFFLPTACNPAVSKKQGRSGETDGRYLSDICFVGFSYSNRIELFQQMNGWDIKLWGPGWNQIPSLASMAMGDGKWVDSHEESRIINGAKIGLNVHSSLEDGSLITRGDFLNPRVFTIPACGTFQLVDEQEALEEVFEAGREVAVYRDVESLKSQVERYLHDDSERRRISENGFERTMAEHTYQHRMVAMLETVGLA